MRRGLILYRILGGSFSQELGELETTGVKTSVPEVRRNDRCHGCARMVATCRKSCKGGKRRRRVRQRDSSPQEGGHLPGQKEEGREGEAREEGGGRQGREGQHPAGAGTPPGERNANTKVAGLVRTKSASKRK